MIISEGIAIGSALGGVCSGMLRTGTWRSKIVAGTFGCIGSALCSGVVIRYYEWPREIDVELGVAFGLAVVGLALFSKIISAIDQFDVLAFFRMKKE